MPRAQSPLAVFSMQHTGPAAPAPAPAPATILDPTVNRSSAALVALANQLPAPRSYRFARETSVQRHLAHLLRHDEPSVGEEREAAPVVRVDLAVLVDEVTGARRLETMEVAEAAAVWLDAADDADDHTHARSPFHPLPNEAEADSDENEPPMVRAPLLMQRTRQWPVDARIATDGHVEARTYARPEAKDLPAVETLIVTTPERRAAAELLDMLDEPVSGTGWPVAEEQFQCPLSLQSFRDPVVAVDGVTYERAFVARHWDLSRSITSPKGGQRLYSTVLVPNLALRDLMLVSAERAADAILASFEGQHAVSQGDPAFHRLREALRLVRVVRGLDIWKRDVAVQAE